VTTNFMVMDGDKGLDYADWAAEVDFVSNDHYVVLGDRALDELSYSANLTSGIAGGRRWFLMEHSTSAVNWRSINLAKPDGALVRDSLTHVAHGADAVCFFQWRQSAAGAEKYHSAMVPHAGEDSEVFRAVTRLGRHLQELAPVSGSRRKPARAAILFDQESWWAAEQDSHPNASLDYRAEGLDWYAAFLDLGVRADVLPTSRSFDEYDVVVAPVLHLVPATMRDRLARFVERGGQLVTTYFSGIVDENDHVWLGGHPGALRDLLGIRIEEFAPLLDGEQVALDDGRAATLWTDRITVTSDDTVVLASYGSGPQAGRPAITRRVLESGSATYVSTRLGTAGIAPLLAQVLDAAGVESELPATLRGQVDLAIRTDGSTDYWFLVNRTDDPVDLGDLGSADTLLSTPIAAPGTASLPGRGVAVLARR
jgi:beta-galactosidase